MSFELLMWALINSFAEPFALRYQCSPSAFEIYSVMFWLGPSYSSPVVLLWNSKAAPSCLVPGPPPCFSRAVLQTSQLMLSLLIPPSGLGSSHSCCFMLTLRPSSACSHWSCPVTLSSGFVLLTSRFYSAAVGGDTGRRYKRGGESWWQTRSNIQATQLGWDKDTRSRRNLWPVSTIKIQYQAQCCCYEYRFLLVSESAMLPIILRGVVCSKKKKKGTSLSLTSFRQTMETEKRISATAEPLTDR